MCGIVGVIGTQLASLEVHQGLLILQHRGQDSAGISSIDNESSKIITHKDIGQVSEIFNEKNLNELKGLMAIGHTRYSTIGEIKKIDLQPMIINFPFSVAMAHNGNLSNFDLLKIKLKNYFHFSTSDNDLELLLQLFALNLNKNKNKTEDLFNLLSLSVKNILELAEGGYSVLTAVGNMGLVAFRDRHGIRPLVYGEKVDEQGKRSFCFSSETSVLNFLGYQDIQEVLPGEIIFVNNQGEIFKRSLFQEQSLPCMFEWIYFAGADSTINTKSVYQVRLKLGITLAKQIKTSDIMDKIDLIAPIPDTSRSSAISLSEELKIPYREVLLKNRYIQRSFIQNNQDKRNTVVSRKFSVIREQVEGKNILLVDDSIVRGTTSKKIIQLLKDYGANEIYFASSCPPVISPCYYGIDFPTNQELIAWNKTNVEIQDYLGAQRVFYNSIQDLNLALDDISYCKACLNSQYPYPIQKEGNDVESTTSL